MSPKMKKIIEVDQEQGQMKSCFGSKEFSKRSSICEQCYLKDECELVFPKTLKRKVSKRYKGERNDNLQRTYVYKELYDKVIAYGLENNLRIESPNKINNFPYYLKRFMEDRKWGKWIEQ